MKALRALAAEKSRTHREQFVGREIEAITLHTPAELSARDRTAALTENFFPVEIQAELPANRLVLVRVTALNADRALQAARSVQGAAFRSGAELHPVLV